MAFRAGAKVLLVAEDGPHGRPVAFDGLVVRDERLERGEQLKALAPVEFLPRGEDGPQVGAGLGFAGHGVFLGEVAVEEDQEAGALAVERLGLGAVVFVERPEDEVAGENGVGGVAVEGPDAVHVLALAACEGDERPGRTPLLILLLAVVSEREERPEVGGGVALRGAVVAVEREQGVLMDGVGGADAAVAVEEERPADEEPVVAGRELFEAEVVRAGEGVAVLVAHERPELPTVELRAVAEVEEGEGEVFRDHVLLHRP